MILFAENAGMKSLLFDADLTYIFLDKKVDC